jgi:hypothetical protein
MQQLTRFSSKEHKEQSPPCVANSRTTSQEIRFILYNLKNCHLVCMTRPVNPTLPRQIRSTSAPTNSPSLILTFSCHTHTHTHARARPRARSFPRGFLLQGFIKNISCFSDTFYWCYKSRPCYSPSSYECKYCYYVFDETFTAPRCTHFFFTCYFLFLRS